jgi:GntR family transcriptional repressor for pyruvate dehydrogenase complex
MTVQRHPSLVDSAIETIRQRIEDGGFVSGDRLPPERVLVDELRISRTVLREALSSLEALGLIEVRGTRGRFVTQGGSSERSRAIVSNWLHDHAREILEMDEIRSILEAHAIRSLNEWEAVDAARRASAVLTSQRDAVTQDDAVEAARLDAEFHRVLASYTKNEALQALLQELIAAARPETLAVYSLPKAAQRSLSQHEEIVDALAQSEISVVADLTRRHLIDVAQRYSALVDAEVHTSTEDSVGARPDADT